MDHAPSVGGDSRSHAGRNGRPLLDRVVLRNRIPRCRVPRPLNPRTTFLAISAAIVALVLSACSGPSRSSTSSMVPATPATAANPVQRENSRPGTPGWEIPADAGAVIAGYAAEISVAPGQSFHLH